MKQVNLLAVRDQLPRGSINQIADTLGIDPKIVSHVFKNGWYSEYRDKVLEVALSIIKGNSDSSNSVLQEAEKLGLTTTSLTPIKMKKKERTVSGKPGFADLFCMDREDLESYIEDNGLETRPDDYNSFWKGSEKNRIALVYALCDELDMDVPDWDEVHELNRSELIDVVNDLELDVTSGDFEDNEAGNEEFANSICDELCLEEPEDE